MEGSPKVSDLHSDVGFSANFGVRKIVYLFLCGGQKPLMVAQASQTSLQRLSSEWGQNLTPPPPIVQTPLHL